MLEDESRNRNELHPLKIHIGPLSSSSSSKENI